jgi:hypothetical protein
VITILVGDVTDYLAQEAIQLDPEARLITRENCKNLIRGVYYTSLGDLDTLHDFIQTLEQAQHLIYCPPPSWSDEKKSVSYMKIWTEYYLLYFLNRKKVSNQNKLPLIPEGKQVMLGLVDERKTESNQLWVAGCSISHGVGVDPDLRYGQLLSQQLDLPVSFLTRSGSSLQWAADQILRSDIRAGDTVVWGLTNFARFSYYSDGRVQHINAGYYELNPEFNQAVSIERLDDDNLVYQGLGRIHAVINFCEKIQARLFLFGLLIDQHELKWVVDLPNYTQFYACFGFDQGLFLDLGTDNEHPGPVMHQWYCDQMLNIIKQQV